MGIFDGCCLASDIDETLMTNGYINPENINQIKFFTDEGGKFVISTGRGVTGLEMLTCQTDIVSTAIVADGCMIYDYKRSEILYQKILQKNDYRITKIIADAAPCIGIEIYSGERVFTLKRNDLADRHQSYLKLSAPDIAFEDICSLSLNKVLYISENAEDITLITQRLKGIKTESDFISSGTVINGIRQYYLEQVPAGASKASALSRLCEIFGIKKGKLFAIGDYYNDVGMLKLSDICAVPENSPDDIKAVADYITCTCRDGAVADFIKYLTKKLN